MSQYIAIRSLNRSSNVRVTASENVYTLTGGASAGQFKLVVTNQADGNSDTTADIAYDASAATVKTALVNLTTSPDLATGTVITSGGDLDTDPIRVAFHGAAGDQDFIITVIDGTTPLTGDVTIETVGRKVKLSPTVDTVIDLDRPTNQRALNRHNAIGQWIVTATNADIGGDALPANS